jgi:hypothetical protein
VELRIHLPKCRWIELGRLVLRCKLGIPVAISPSTKGEYSGQCWIRKLTRETLTVESRHRQFTRIPVKAVKAIKELKGKDSRGSLIEISGVLECRQTEGLTYNPESSALDIRKRRPSVRHLEQALSKLAHALS